MSSPALRPLLAAFLIFTGIIGANASLAQQPAQAAAAQDRAIQTQLQLAGENAKQLRLALEQTPDDELPGMRFLIEHMPERDLKTLSADFLRENVKYAYRAWRESPWHESVDEAMFFNYILPYANVNESRDRWRKDFFERFRGLAADAKTPGEAAVLLNQKLFQQTGVKYSTKRRRADQGPSETLDTGLASCTGLSVLLIDACRTVGVPARFVGTPMWSDRSGNHSWIEVWDGEWKFTGAAEPTGDQLNQGWFTGKASSAKADQPRLAIYAVSYKRTPLKFLCSWDRRIDYLSATNVTSRYTASHQQLPAGSTLAMFRVVDPQSNERQTCGLTVRDSTGETILSGTTNDESYDANDHAQAVLKLGEAYLVEIAGKGRTSEQTITPTKPNQVFTFAPPAATDKSPTQPAAGPVNALREYLSQPSGDRQPLAEQAFAKASLTPQQAGEARKLLWDDHAAQVESEHGQAFENRKLTVGEREMPFFYKTFGEKPAGGRSLYISMHGGGGAPARVNDRQYENQKRLYQPAEGVYVAPRAPTNTWNLWHEPHIDQFFEQLIAAMVVMEDVNPNRVYLMGYSAGGDGVFQLAPRMADRWAACAMMAGHPNDASPLGLRNIGFTLFMGGRDAAYDRNKMAAEWKERLAKLQADDPQGYRHLVTIYPDKGHWMDGEDKSALEWMAEFRRDPAPKHIVWKQDDVLRSTFYWLKAVDPQRSAEVTAHIDGQTIQLTSSVPQKLRVRLDDRLLDLDKPVRIVDGSGKELTAATLPRTIATLAATLKETGDCELAFAAELQVEVR